MSDTRISDLPVYELGSAEPVGFIATVGEHTGKVTLSQLSDVLIGNMGVAVIKCKHCGQWGARFCECIKCGAPIE